MSDLAVSAKRVGPPWRSVWWPACVGGHRALMEPEPTRYGFICGECGWFLPAEDWYAFLSDQMEGVGAWPPVD